MGLLALFALLLTLCSSLRAQYVYTINADSVKITNHCDTAELIIENHTQSVPGFPYNKGRGRTEFRRVLQKIDDTTYMVGSDTLKMPAGPVTASNGLSVTGDTVQLGGTYYTQSKATLQTDRWIPLNKKSIFFVDSTGSVELASNYILLSQLAGDPYVIEVFIDAERSEGVDNAMLSLFGYDSVNAGIDLISHGSLRGGVWNNAGNMIFSQHSLTTGNLISVNLNTGRVGIGTTTPTANFQLPKGSQFVNRAPLKFISGNILTTPEDGAVEYNGTDYFVTVGTARYILSKTLTGQLTTGFGGGALTAFNSITTTLAVTGAQAGDVVSVSANSGAVNPPSIIIITAYVTSTNTVTLQAYNASSSSVTLASDTYKVRVVG